MINLSEDQTEFLEKEFGITIQQIEIMGKKEWVAVKEKCFDTVLDELLDEDGHYNQANEDSERCSLAESILDVKFRDLRS